PVTARRCPTATCGSAAARTEAPVSGCADASEAGPGGPFLVPRRGAGRSPHEVGEGYVEAVGDQEQMVDAGGVHTLFDPVDGLAVQAHELGELLLGEPPGGAGGADTVSDLSSAGEIGRASCRERVLRSAAAVT